MISRRKFFKSSEGKKLGEKRSKELIEKETRALTQAARECLDSPAFKKYKTQYDNSREKIMAVLELYEEPDPTKYGFFCRESLSMLFTLGQLLRSVKDDARDKMKGPEDEAV